MAELKMGDKCKCAFGNPANGKWRRGTYLSRVGRYDKMDVLYKGKVTTIRRRAGEVVPDFDV